jgi:3'(2'), 5'-bisphosphate nucleotidase
MLSDICTIARDAGATILRYYKSGDLSVDAKVDGTPVTVADREADGQIRQALEQLDGSIPCISEESAVPPYETRRDWRRFWLVDPLDGTKEFVRGTDEFTVNIALIDNGIPVLGVVYVPPLNAMYYAEAGRGTWKQVGGAAPEQLYSAFPDPTGELIVAESRSHPSPHMEEFLKDYRVKARVAAGSSLKFCLLAEGSADIYPRLGRTMEWDVAAGDCVYRHSKRDGAHPVSLRYNTPLLRHDGFVIGLEPGTFALPTSS